MKKDFAFVLVQFVLFALYVIDFDLFGITFEMPTWLDLGAVVLGFFGAVVITFGIINMNENLTPFPTPRRNSSLISGGIYKYIRHPIYSGIILLFLAYGLYTGSIGRLIITIILSIVFYFKTELEEELLIERFPGYRHYKGVTGRFFPKLG
ncbi:isoprenylcysteine carboxylmethyltransferase family protein [Pukyongia salina]|uniref:Isoprenylcysteine carboxylmethyltransferase family protein n=1 Tax=Pukyongia salina TaxID=2094025 RepID=A0A2S0HSM1_9FLAO|nr:isoprenylcysteine carboxylmethyltransferase family protein [Pukyongia salina]AVI49691.1 isoprenylcysteine carboxylmethyltransferase family protein [Pukyongia salina]